MTPTTTASLVIRRFLPGKDHEMSDLLFTQAGIGLIVENRVKVLVMEYSQVCSKRNYFVLATVNKS